MKQHEQDDAALYRALQKQFQMSPEQTERLEQKILSRAEKQPQINQFSVRRSIKRTLPLAACIALAVSGAVMFRQKLPEPETLQSSAVEYIEQTMPQDDQQPASALTHTAALPAVSGTETDTKNITHETTLTAAETAKVTVTVLVEHNETTALVTTGTTVTNAPETTAAVMITQETASTLSMNATSEAMLPPETTAAVLTEAQGSETAVTTVHSEQTATTLQPQNNLCLVIPDMTAHAGETVTVKMHFSKDVYCAGIQCGGTVQSSDERSVRIKTIGSELGKKFTEGDEITLPVMNAIDNDYIIVWGQERDVWIPAGTVLIEMEIEIPQDAAAGTVYRFTANESDIIIISSKQDVIPLELQFGSITIE